MKNEQKKKSFSLKTYFKKHWYILLILIMVPIASVIFFCLVFKNNLYDISAWASISSGLFTYIGTSFLSIFIYYNSWKDNTIGYNKNIPDIEVQCMGEFIEEKNTFSLFDYKDIKDEMKIMFIENNAQIVNKIENFKFYQITIKNLSLNKIKNISPCFYLTIEDEKYHKNYTFFAGLTNHNFPLDYKESTTLYFGVEKQKIEELYKDKYFSVLRFVYFVQYENNEKDYLISDAILGNTLGTGTNFINLNAQNKDTEFPYKVSKYYKQFLK